MTEKEKILSAAEKLLEESGGDVTAVTVRAVAQRAGVGTGLINYHFSTKENLVEICVQRKIQEVVKGFVPAAEPEGSPRERLLLSAQRIFGFLFRCDAFSRISILGDMNRPKADSNTALTRRILLELLPQSYSREEKELLIFTLVAAMQSAFLQAGQLTLDTPQARDAYMERLVSLLWKDTKQEERV